MFNGRAAEYWLPSFAKVKVQQLIRTKCSAFTAVRSGGNLTIRQERKSIQA